MNLKITLLWTVGLLAMSSILSGQGSQRSAPLTWEEVGPVSIASRTRALLIDNRDPSHATIYAGASTGGLWKSTDHGGSWHVLHTVHSCGVISCIAQDANGIIYFGTGEGLVYASGSSRSDGSPGNGLHMLYGTDQDSILPATVPMAVSNFETWSMINRIAINPTNARDIFAATSGVSTSGLLHSLDGGLTWVQVGTSAAPIAGLAGGYYGAADVKFSSDGANVFASVGPGGITPGSRLIRSNNGGTSFTYVQDTSFSSSIDRIEIAVAPSDPSMVYISIATSNGDFGGVIRSDDAGLTWTAIGRKGPALDPFGNSNQGWYDNAISVYPHHADMLYIGGTSLYTYSPAAGWHFAGGLPNADWVLSDIHTIVFDDKDSNLMYIGCDGGIFKSQNAISSFPDPTYQICNTNYNTTKCYSVAADIDGNVLTGTESMGNQYIRQHVGTQRVFNGHSGSSSNGVYTEISHFDPNVFVGGHILGKEMRSNDRGMSWVSLYDNAIDPQGYGEPSRCGQPYSNAPFITAFWLVETKSATNSVSKVPFTDHISHSAGDMVTIVSHIGQTFQESLASPLPAGDTAYFTDRLQSRLYLASACGLWMTPDVINFTNTPRWFRITSGSDDVLSFAATATGDTIYMAGNSTVIKISGLNSVLFDTFSTGQYMNFLPGYAQYHSDTARVIGSGEYIEGLDVDIHDPNHVLCTVARFPRGLTSHVFASHDAGHTWTPVGAGLPDMPVYQCVIDAYDAQHYIVGSELGIWDSYDAGATWSEQAGGIDLRVPVYRLRQQSYLNDQCYALYAGTFGRGVWRCTTMTAAQAGCTVLPLGSEDLISEKKVNKMSVYPNPLSADMGMAMIELSGVADVILRVIDMQGREMESVQYPQCNKGKNVLDFSAASLANGAYMVVAAVSDGPIYVSRLIVAN